mgnify:CR=1 FL=1
MNPFDSARLSARMALAAALLAVNPAGLGGVALRGCASPLRDQWLALLRRLLPADSPWLRVPSHAGDAAMLGGLDLTATLAAGRPVAQQGLLEQAAPELAAALAQGGACDNRVAIWSCRYAERPLVIQGPGAGAGVTAAALLDDIRRAISPGLRRGS